VRPERLALVAAFVAAVCGTAMRAFGGALACVDPLCLGAPPVVSAEWAVAMAHRLAVATMLVAFVASALRLARRRPGAVLAALAAIGAAAVAGGSAHASLLSPWATGAHLAASVATVATLAWLAFPPVGRGAGASVLVAALATTAVSVGAGADVACGAWPLCEPLAPSVGLGAVAARAGWVAVAAVVALAAWRSAGPRADALHLALRVVGLVIAADVAVVLTRAPELVLAQGALLHLSVVAVVWAAATPESPVESEAGARAARRSTLPSHSPVPHAGAPTS